MLIVHWECAKCHCTVHFNMANLYYVHFTSIKNSQIKKKRKKKEVPVRGSYTILNFSMCSKRA